MADADFEQLREQVRTVIAEVLVGNSPGGYDPALFVEKCGNVFHLMLDYASPHRK